MNKQQVRKMYNDVISKYGFTPDFDLDQFDEDEVLQFSCRNNGDVGDGKFGMPDYQNAKSIMKELKSQYSIAMDIECVDEWVIITIEST
tara:strand:- start:44696 stop:44962 length:267 start_codon:yes stop_codon:yes gene_type:complete